MFLSEMTFSIGSFTLLKEEGQIMTALIAIFLFSDFFYGGQDIGLYLFGAAPCGVFVYSANDIEKLGFPFTGGDDFNGHNLPFGHFDWPKRMEISSCQNMESANLR
jgi:hypothetical protein